MSDNHLHIVSFDVPYPANYGGVIDVFYKVKALAAHGVKVHLHCFEYGRQPAPCMDDFCYSVNYYKRNTSPFLALRKQPYIVCSRHSDALLANLKKDNHNILLEGLHSCDILLDDDLRGRKIFVRTHNVEHDYYQYLAKTEKNFKKRMFLLMEAKKLQCFESVLAKADGIFPISPKDYEYFAARYNNVSQITAYNAFDTVDIVKGRGEYVLYHGNLEVSENYDAAAFIVDVFRNTEIRLKIAGKNPPAFLKQKISESPNIELVENPNDELMQNLIRNAHVNILVTSQSTGLKLKLLNALFNGRFCVVNDKMVEGLETDGLLHQANDAESLRNIVTMLMQHSFDDEQIMIRKNKMSEFYDIAGTTDKLMKLLF